MEDMNIEVSCCLMASGSFIKTTSASHSHEGGEGISSLEWLSWKHTL